MHTDVYLARLACALTLACALAACGGGSSGGGFSGTAAGSTATGSEKTETPVQPAASDNADVRYAP
ncbi:hypothetical protein LJR290_001628 [Variovorax sp. LjRoot290]|uniref:hypothetical protein n=1 Tax=unclassified Variovorax TaxID=663243 RepID=UPI003ED02B4A